MSKLSEALKACISASHARPGMVAAPPQIRSVYQSIRDEAQTQNLGLEAWLAMATATTMTMNSPDSLNELHGFATSARGEEKPKKKPVDSSVYIAEFMREVGLKCISFNGIPRTINCLGNFRENLPEDTKSALSTEPKRKITTENISAVKKRGRELWDSVYSPFENKLCNNLSKSHPDLPIHILHSHYGPLLSNFPEQTSSPARVGRVLTSVVAVACLRAQTGVAQQVISHVFGLRKAYTDGTAKAQGEQAVEGGSWLASDEGNLWLLQKVDSIVEAIGQGSGSTFAMGRMGKL